MRERLPSLIKIHLITILMTACSAGGNCVPGVAFAAAMFERKLAGWAGLIISLVVMFFLADSVLFTKYTGILAVMAAFTLIFRTMKHGKADCRKLRGGEPEAWQRMAGDKEIRDMAGGAKDLRERGLYAGFGTALLELTGNLFAGLSLLNVGLALWYGVACGIMTILFGKGVTFLLTGGVPFREQRSEAMISTAFFLAASVYAVISVGFLPDFVWQSLAFLLLLAMGHAYGPAMGAVSGAAVGIVLSFLSGEITYLGILCFLGLLCGIFRELGRFAEAMAFFAGTAGMMFCGVPFLTELRWMTGILTAGGLWIICDLFLKIRERYREKRNAAECAVTVPKQGAKIVETGYENGEADVLSADFSGDCDKRMAEILEEFASEVLNLREEKEEQALNPEIAGRFWEEKYLETRDTLAVWMTETGELLKVRHVPGNSFERLEEEPAGILKKRCAQHGVQMQEAWRRQTPDGQTELRFLWSIGNRSERRTTRAVMVKDLIPVINETFGVTFEPSRENRNLIGKEQAIYEFIRTPNFRILQGSATTKKDEADGNGDMFGVTRIGTAQVLFGIADGVGSGRDASDAAAHSFEQLEQLLKSGITEETALRLIDSMEILKDGQGASLDFGVINLNTGICHLLKAGGAPGFVLRGQWVEKLEAKTLPLGLMPGARYEQKVKKLYDGDMILLVSDGVLQAFPDGDRAETIGNCLAEIGELGPRDLAQCLLDKALSFGKAADDMSVLAIGIYDTRVSGA